MLYNPWPHQLKSYNEIEAALSNGARSVINVIPTRGGKSWVAARLIEARRIIEARPGQTIYFIAHTKILITQMSQELTDHGIYHGIIAPWAPRVRCNVQVISKDTLLNRMASMRRQGWAEPALLILDECHLSAGDGFKRILAFYEESKLVGFTGSPCRLDNRPLGDIYQYMVIGPSHHELQAAKRLCPIDTYGVNFAMPEIPEDVIDTESEADYTNQPYILRGIVDEWESVALGKKTLGFCSSIAHAENMAAAFTEAGHPAIALSSAQDDDEIDNGLEAFYDGRVTLVFSVNLFLMGLTVKDCECIIQARRTNSLMIYLQSTGRGMMYMPGKRLINIDAVNNYLRHGKPDDDREWSLDHEPVREVYASRLKRCPHCYRMPSKGASVCFYCGHEFTAGDGLSRLPEEVDGTLELIGGDPLAEAIRSGSVWSVVQARGAAITLGLSESDGENLFLAISENNP